MLKRYCFLLLAVCSLSAADAVAQQGPSPSIRAVIDGLVGVLNASDNESISLFIAQKVDPEYVGRVGNESLEMLLREMREAVAGAGDLGVDRMPNGLKVMFSGGAQRAAVLVGVPFQEPNLITHLALEVEDPNAEAELPESLSAGLRIRGLAIEDVWAPGPDRVQRFMDQHVRPDAATDELRQTLEFVKAVGAAAGSISVQERGNEIMLELGGPRSADIRVALETEPPFRVISVTATETEREALPPPPTLSWDTLEAQLDEAHADGFSGTVVVMRNGAVPLHRAFGDARPNGEAFDLDTQYDIGSMPIDFTRGAVLLAAQRGVLDLDAPISEYLDEVPADKQGISIRHLMTGASGLPNYHHVSADPDADLSYIDRDEAVRRILDHQLLFQPGTDERHSHSAWTLVAALVELRTGEPFGDFLQENFFDPAAMTRTGFYGDPRFDAENQAIGLGSSRPTSPNVPANWGPTSWLVMGAGGMVSTPGDLLKWYQFLWEGSPLTATSRRMIPTEGMSVGDSDRGYLTMKTVSPDAVIIASTNSFDRMGDATHQVIRGLLALSSGN